jgi:hypothetical protein
MKGQTAKNPLASMAWRLASAISRQGAPCAVCGSYEDVQMHHVRALKDIAKSKNAVHKYMIAVGWVGVAQPEPRTKTNTSM